MEGVEYIKNVLKKEIEKQINEEYTNYKNKKIQDLDYELEKKRNAIVQDILNSVSIMNENTLIGINMMIKVENRIILKESKW